MAKKKQTPVVLPPVEPVLPLYVELPKWLKEALVAVAAKERRNMKATLTIILEEAVAKHGHFPPS